MKTSIFPVPNKVLVECLKGIRLWEDGKMKVEAILKAVHKLWGQINDHKFLQENFDKRDNL
jgi:hypothetical protein